MTGWGRRYLRIGAGIGLVMAFFMSVTIPMLLMNLVLAPLCGAAIGGLLGSLAASVREALSSSQSDGSP